MHTNLLTTDEAYKPFRATENKTNFITDIFFLKYYLDLELLRCLPGYCFLLFLFLIISKKNFEHSERLVLEEMSFRSDSECLGNSNSVEQKIVRNCHSEIL